MSRILHLSLKAEYFNAIVSGEKTQEFRLVNAYWTKRLVDRKYDTIHMTLGYPPSHDPKKHLWLPYRGFVRAKITHPHFGPNEVEVFVIDVSPEETL